MQILLRNRGRPLQASVQRSTEALTECGQYCDALDDTLKIM
jgi:hypothetical protein